ncbi:hypothetical protein BP6252_13803 [Coleophoma cylindrospora]|uniref:Transcription factor domain-containing protein n=1 Tax=Coleophoma cylindrospora TaxID=1849047 RepID=A0A3D8Q6J2_9HELO|nr:hypothetical protein BP6252_13803 [Coleophoma cylindrospora]
MAKSKYAAGLQFIPITPAQGQDKHTRKAIQSHATRAGARRRPLIELRPWINPHRELEPLEKAISEDTRTSKPDSSIPSPRLVGADFSGMQLPPGIEPYMIQDLVKLIDLNRHGVYPYEICLDVHPTAKGWFPYLISDVCCLHSMMFSVRAFLERTAHNQPSPLAAFHYAQTLHLLQARLNESDPTSAISDATMMVVISLATAAELTNDFATVAKHFQGLEKMVSLRGGVRALNTENNIQVKVCRADLEYALLLGHRPRLLQEGISWDCFIADRGRVRCSHPPHDANLHAFAETAIDVKLHNALQDLHAFSCISNLAYQTTRKLSPEVYNEMMISILYRLTNLSFGRNHLAEAIRIGLLAFSSTIFIERHFMGQPSQHLLNLYTDALFKLRNSTNVDLPIPMVLWLTMFSHLVVHTELSAADWRSVWLDEAVLRGKINTWPQACEILRSVAWVDFVHSRSGKPIFEVAMSRLERTASSDV